MRILGGAVTLLLAGVPPAFALQGTDERDQLLQELQKKVADLERRLDARAEPAPSAGLETRLDEILHQTPVDPPSAASRLNVSAPANDNLTLSGSFRWRGTYWQSYANGFTGGDHEILSFDQHLRLGFNFRVTEKTQVYFEANDARVWGQDVPTAPGGFFAGSGYTGADAHLEVTAANLQVSDVYGTGFDLTMGRHAVRHGAGRQFGVDPWLLNPTRFDGITAHGELDDQTSLDFHYLRTFDGDQAFADEFSPVGTLQNSDLYAVYLTHDSGADSFGTLEAFYVLQDIDPQAGGFVDRTHLNTYGARWTHDIEGFSFDVETATQFGKIVGVRTKDYGFDNWMLASRLQYSIPDAVILRGAVAGWDYATGGKDAFRPIAPEIHSWFGLTDKQTWSNVEHFMLGLDFTVSESAEDNLRFSWHWQRLQDGNQGFAGLANFGGATGMKDLGQEWNLVYSVDCTKTSTFDAGFAWFYPGDAFTAATGQTQDIQFAYLQYGLSF